jgi:hypothetical protein
VPWKLDATIDAGRVVLCDDWLGAGDPSWTAGGVDVEVRVPRGSYPVELVTATHALYGTRYAAAHVVVDPSADVERWELVAPVAPTYPADGYIVQTGVGSFGDVDALLDPPSDAMDAAPFWSGGTHWQQFDTEAGGSIVAFTVAGQDQVCRTWRGLDAAGRVVRVRTDFGLLD